ncbi:MAG TPA: alpha/beta hydrolase [Allosphingosinicella sp.]|nr:alpha/beta hydrolase [Allosphingosinicella sp.]
MGPAGIGMAAAAAAAAMVSSPIEAPGPSGPLKGVLLAPAERAGVPLVLIVPGSGPTDRDGNSPLGIAAAPYRLLAEALAERGVASARIDKRGMFGSAAAAADANAVTVGDYAKDVGAWVAMLRRETGVRCVWLAGHSEGGLVAAASARGEGVCGAILIAAAGRPLGQVLREQLRANPANAPILPDAEAAITALEAGKRVDVAAFHPALQNLFSPAIQPFLIDLFSHDPAALLRGYERPLLVVQGENDLQVSTGDARLLAAANPAARLVLLPGVNHVLKEAPADRAANAASYANPKLPLAPGIADAIAEFVKRPR